MHIGVPATIIHDHSLFGSLYLEGLCQLPQIKLKCVRVISVFAHVHINVSRCLYEGVIAQS